MRSQQQAGLLTASGSDGPENLAVLFVSEVNARLFGEIQPPDNANAVGHIPVNARHFCISSSLNQGTVERLVSLRHLCSIAATR